MLCVNRKSFYVDISNHVQREIQGNIFAISAHICAVYEKKIPFSINILDIAPSIPSYVSRKVKTSYNLE